MTFFLWLAGTKLGRAIAAIGAAAVALAALLFRAKRQGRADAIKDFTDADQAEADAIRRRADAEYNRRVPKRDDLRGRRD